MSAAYLSDIYTAYETFIPSAIENLSNSPQNQYSNDSISKYV